MILQSRFSRAVDALKENGIDAWIIIGRAVNILGEPSLLFLMPIEAMSYTAIIVTKEGEKVCITGGLIMEEVEESGLFTQTQTYQSLDDMKTRIVDVLKSCNFKNKIALNINYDEPSSDGLTHSQYLFIQECLEAAGYKGEIVPSTPIMKKIRGKKSDEEVRKIAHTVSESMKIYDEARPFMKTGMSGYDVQSLFKRIANSKGYGFSWYEPGNPFVSVGARSSYMCKLPPKDVYIQPGDLVNVDFGIRIDGFSSDNQRSFYALRPGETGPPEEVMRAFKTIQEMNATVCKNMKTGVDSAELTKYGNEIMLKNGYEQGWRGGYGHEIGLFAHNGGISAGFNPAQIHMDTFLEENMTFTLEPAIITSCGRLCQEEVVQVTNGGGKMLSTPQKEVWIINQ
jgi:Xaa-Pro aminopeptidase